MKLYEILNKALDLISTASSLDDQEFSYTKVTADEKFVGIKKSDFQLYISIIEEVFSSNEKLHTKFTKENLFKFIQDKIFHKYMNNEQFQEKDNNSFFSELEAVKPQSAYITAPISGIRLDKNDKVKISIFEIGKANGLVALLNNNKYDYYISVKINNFYDKDIAIQEAHNLFLDFIRIISFMSGISNKKIAIKIGLPTYPHIDHYSIFTATNSFYISESLEDKFFNMSIKNDFIQAIPVDDDFFFNSSDFNKLWEFLEKHHNNQNLTDMQSRLLNCSISVGESLFNSNTKNSIIYTSIALEILFSLDERELFQQSIGEKISEGFAYLIGENPESRIKASRFVKKFYGIRSAIVHGGKASINNDYITINQYLRSCIKTFLNDDELSKIKTLQEFRELLLKARYSY